jgi:hypothetical protein
LSLPDGAQLPFNPPLRLEAPPSFRPADEVWGVQGRYFVPILPLIAVMFAAVLNCGLDVRVTAFFAVSLGYWPAQDLLMQSFAQTGISDP